MVLNYKYRLYVNKHSDDLSELVTTANKLWNHVVGLYRRYYKRYGKNPTTVHMQKHMAKLAKNNKYYSLMGSQSIQEVCQRVDATYKEFFKKKGRGRPTFHKSQKSGSFCFKGTVGYRLDGNTIIINKLGRTYRFKLTRQYGTVKQVRIKRDNNGYLWLVICTDVQSKQYDRQGDACIGLDFGLKHFLTTSDGGAIDSPQFFRQSLNDIRKKNLALSRKVKDSNGYNKAKRDLSKAHERIANKRSEFHWWLAHELCKHNSFIAIEDLNLAAMKRLWGRKVSDLGFSSFVLKLSHVAKKYGTELIQIDRYEATSQTCHVCGGKNPETKDLRVREWQCPHCGTTHNRDVNAAINILCIGKGGKGVSLGGSRCQTAEPCGEAASGDDFQRIPLL